MDTDEELSQEPWLEQEPECPRARCQELLCQRVRDVRLYSMELGEMRFERASKGRKGVWLQSVGSHRVSRVYALLLRGGYNETNLPRPCGISPTYCVFLDCASVEAALGRAPEGTAARLIDWKIDVLRRNDKLGRRCWTCGFKCGVAECNYRECARCGMRGHVRGACRTQPSTTEHNRGDSRGWS